MPWGGLYQGKWRGGWLGSIGYVPPALRNIYVRSAGSWAQVSTVFVRLGGTWVQTAGTWVRSAGTWIRLWE